MHIVLDTSAILSGKHVSGSTVTVPTVINEFNEGGHSWRLLQYAKSAGMQVRQPTEVYRKRVIDAADQTGDALQLSKADMDVLALTLELQNELDEVVLLTDDYAIQNVAAALDLVAQGILQPGIRQHWCWHYRCRSCGRTFETVPAECPVCGGPIKRVRKG